MSFLVELPTECTTLVFSFLELSDCFSVGSTCLSMMKEVMPSLNRRRLQAKTEYSYITRRQTLLETKEIGLYEQMRQNYQTMDLIRIPTVEERVDELSRSIPVSHRLHGSVVELRKQLLEDISNDAISSVAPFFTKIFPMFQKVVSPLKLYVWIVQRVLRSNPILGNSGDGRVALSEYIGDVLCVTYLFHPGCMNLNELSTNLSKLLDDIRSNPDSIPVYMSWVFLHSTVLRTKKFNSHERKRLGVMELQALDVGGSMIIPMNCFRTEKFMSSEMMLVLDTFGPLGTTYRLRDIVQTLTISAHCLFAYFNTIEGFHDDYNNSNNNSTEIIIRGSAGELATEWLFVAHEEVRKLRPMTVRQPVIRIAFPSE